MAETLAKLHQLSNSNFFSVIRVAFKSIVNLTSTAMTDFATEPLAKHMVFTNSMPVSCWPVVSDDSDDATTVL